MARVGLAALTATAGLVVPVTTQRAAGADARDVPVHRQHPDLDRAGRRRPGDVRRSSERRAAASANAEPGGGGGHTQATLPVTSGSTVNILVGGMGGDAGGCGNGNFDLQPGGGGGFNGGASGTSAQCPGGGGGGATDVRIGGVDVSESSARRRRGRRRRQRTTEIAPPLVVRGGGQTGGKGQCSHGGSGGDQTGSTGSGQYGFGSTGAGRRTGSSNFGGGGGGGGYWGGAGGSIVPCEQSAGGGGGGSAFGPAGAVFETGGRTGNGVAVDHLLDGRASDCLEHQPGHRPALRHDHRHDHRHQPQQRPRWSSDRPLRRDGRRPACTAPARRSAQPSARRALGPSTWSSRSPESRPHRARSPTWRPRSRCRRSSNCSPHRSTSRTSACKSWRRPPTGRRWPAPTCTA